jgi:hypothetical protein
MKTNSKIFTDIKIFMGLKEIAGHYNKLKFGFDEIGVKSTFLDLSYHPFKYSDQKQNVVSRIVKKLVEKRRQSIKRENLISRIFAFSLWKVIKMIVFIYAVIKYDVFVFSFNSSFFSFYDLPVLKFMKKKIIYRFHGADCRPAFLSGGLVGDSKNFNVEECIRRTLKKKRMLKKIEKYADVIISNPLFSHFLERPFVLGPRIGIPSKIHTHEDKKDKDKELSTVNRSEGKVRVLHAPSHREAKGTGKIRMAVANLQKRGCAVELVEIHGKENKVVLAELPRCDFILDQLYSDTPMAALTVEAAFFSKPAVVGGYAKEENSKFYPPGHIPPSYYCHPDNYEDAVLQLIEDEDYRLELGRRAKEFVDTNWRPAIIAERYLQLIGNNIPKDWWYDPKDIRYVHGAGLSEKRAKEVLQSIIETGGKEALQLSDKPELEQLFVEFAYSEN